MQNKIVILSEREAAVILAALAARKQVYVKEMNLTDIPAQELIFNRLAHDCDTAFLKVANAESEATVGVEVTQSWWRRLLGFKPRRCYGRVTIPSL